MIEKTIIVIGPGGVGKSPLDYLFKDNIKKIDPYRLRDKGPRNNTDYFYANPKIYNELHILLKELNDNPRQIGKVEWFPKSKTLFFKVRSENQFIFLLGLSGKLAKAEIYSPVLPDILSDSDIRKIFGTIDIIILNPSSQSIAKMENLKEIEEQTLKNCTERGDSKDSIDNRISSISEEIPAWKILIDKYTTTEYIDWSYPKYLYKKSRENINLIEHQKEILKNARNCLVNKKPELDLYFKDKLMIDNIKEPFA